jgi:hypothetical protein
VITFPRRVCIALFAAFVAAVPLAAQTPNEIEQYNALVRQYNAIRGDLSPSERARVLQLFAEYRAALTSRGRAGVLSTNLYVPGATSATQSRYSPDSPAYPYGEYGSPYSANGARNPYTTGGLDIIGADGQYLGKLNANRYDPNSVANPYGPYGSPYSATSVNNPYSAYGSPYSSLSARNPYTTTPPRLYVPQSRVVVPGLPPLPQLR